MFIASASVYYLRRFLSSAVTMADSSSESAPESDGIRNRKGIGNSAESSMEKKILSAITSLSEKLSTQCKRMDEQDKNATGSCGQTG